MDAQSHSQSVVVHYVFHPERSSDALSAVSEAGTQSSIRINYKFREPSCSQTDQSHSVEKPRQERGTESKDKKLHPAAKRRPPTAHKLVCEIPKSPELRKIHSDLLKSASELEQIYGVKVDLDLKDELQEMLAEQKQEAEKSRNLRAGKPRRTSPARRQMKLQGDKSIDSDKFTEIIRDLLTHTVEEYFRLKPEAPENELLVRVLVKSEGADVFPIFEASIRPAQAPPLAVQEREKFTKLVGSSPLDIGPHQPPSHYMPQSRERRPRRSLLPRPVVPKGPPCDRCLGVAPRSPGRSRLVPQGEMNRVRALPSSPSTAVKGVGYLNSSPSSTETKLEGITEKTSESSEFLEEATETPSSELIRPDQDRVAARQPKRSLQPPYKRARAPRAAPLPVKDEPKSDDSLKSAAETSEALKSDLVTKPIEQQQQSVSLVSSDKSSTIYEGQKSKESQSETTTLTQSEKSTSESTEKEGIGKKDETKKGVKDERSPPAEEGDEDYFTPKGGDLMSQQVDPSVASGWQQARVNQLLAQKLSQQRSPTKERSEARDGNESKETEPTDEKDTEAKGVDAPQTSEDKKPQVTEDAKEQEATTGTGEPEEMQTDDKLGEDGGKDAEPPADTEGVEQTKPQEDDDKSKQQREPAVGEMAKTGDDKTKDGEESGSKDNNGSGAKADETDVDKAKSEEEKPQPHEDEGKTEKQTKDEKLGEEEKKDTTAEDKKNGSEPVAEETDGDKMAIEGSEEKKKKPQMEKEVENEKVSEDEGQTKDGEKEAATADTEDGSSAATEADKGATEGTEEQPEAKHEPETEDERVTQTAAKAEPTTDAKNEDETKVEGSDKQKPQGKGEEQRKEGAQAPEGSDAKSESDEVATEEGRKEQKPETEEEKDKMQQTEESPPTAKREDAQSKDEEGKDSGEQKGDKERSTTPTPVAERRAEAVRSAEMAPKGWLREYSLYDNYRPPLPVKEQKDVGSTKEGLERDREDAKDQRKASDDKCAPSSVSCVDAIPSQSGVTSVYMMDASKSPILVPKAEGSEYLMDRLSTYASSTSTQTAITDPFGSERSAKTKRERKGERRMNKIPVASKSETNARSPIQSSQYLRRASDTALLSQYLPRQSSSISSTHLQSPVGCKRFGGSPMGRLMRPSRTALPHKSSHSFGSYLKPITKKQLGQSWQQKAVVRLEATQHKSKHIQVPVRDQIQNINIVKGEQMLDAIKEQNQKQKVSPVSDVGLSHDTSVVSRPQEASQLMSVEYREPGVSFDVANVNERTKGTQMFDGSFYLRQVSENDQECVSHQNHTKATQIGQSYTNSDGAKAELRNIVRAGDRKRG